MLSLRFFIAYHIRITSYNVCYTKLLRCDNRIRQTIHSNLDKLEQGKDVDNKTAIDRFFGLAGAVISSYCGDKEKFLGPYHGYGNPIGVMNGDLGGELNS